MREIEEEKREKRRREGRMGKEREGVREIKSKEGERKLVRGSEEGR